MFSQFSTYLRVVTVLLPSVVQRLCTVVRYRNLSSWKATLVSASPMNLAMLSPSGFYV